ncbi:MAG TPA: type I 3-dehydroquinate dehydratase [Rhizomicrobium sp.]|nr:type I 3-dehydroquinate dehydratase [Rhizomicrobium sp.]
MLKLGSLALGGNVPRVAIGFSDDVLEADILDARRGGVDIAEVRIDLFRSIDPVVVVKKLAIFQALPTIATIRTPSEGGKWAGTEQERIALFHKVIPHVDAIDVELASLKTTTSVIDAAHKARKLVVISHHDFNGTPKASALETIISKAQKAGADIIKIATHIESSVDVRALAAVLTDTQRNLVVIGMGAKGLVTRLSFPAMGSLMTFASHGGFQTAPGQIPYSNMMEELRLLYPEYNEEKIVKLQLLESA